MSPWKSRWSRVRLVKTATSKAQPWTRFEGERVGGRPRARRGGSPRPPSRGSSACRSDASGVVRTASARRSPIRYSTVPRSPPSVRPRAARRRPGRLVVVLPLVPVMPTSSSERAGSPRTRRRERSARASASVADAEPGALGLRRGRGGTATAPFLRAALDEAVPVGREARDGHEERAGGAAARVVGHVGDSPARDRRAAPRPRQPGQLAERRHRTTLDGVGSLRRPREHARHPRLDLRPRIGALGDDVAGPVAADDQPPPRGERGGLPRRSGPRRSIMRPGSAVGGIHRAARPGPAAVGRGSTCGLYGTVRRTRPGSSGGTARSWSACSPIAGEDRRGHVAALVAAPRGAVERDEHHERRGAWRGRSRRTTRRGRPSSSGPKHRPSAPFRSSPPPRSPAMAARLPVPSRTTAAHQLGEHVDRRRVDDAAHRDRLELPDDSPARVLDPAHDQRLHEVAAVGDRAHGDGHLQRRDARPPGRRTSTGATARSTSRAASGGRRPRRAARCRWERRSRSRARSG